MYRTKKVQPQHSFTTIKTEKSTLSTISISRAYIRKKPDINVVALYILILFYHNLCRSMTEQKLSHPVVIKALWTLCFFLFIFIWKFKTSEKKTVWTCFLVWLHGFKNSHCNNSWLAHLNCRFKSAFLITCTCCSFICLSVCLSVWNLCTFFTFSPIFWSK